MMHSLYSNTYAGNTCACADPTDAVTPVLVGEVRPGRVRWDNQINKWLFGETRDNVTPQPVVTCGRSRSNHSDPVAPSLALAPSSCLFLIRPLRPLLTSSPPTPHASIMFAPVLARRSVLSATGLGGSAMRSSGGRCVVERCPAISHSSRCEAANSS
jgi:hypothetical protein